MSDTNIQVKVNSSMARRPTGESNLVKGKVFYGQETHRRI